MQRDDDLIQRLRSPLEVEPLGEHYNLMREAAATLEMKNNQIAVLKAEIATLKDKKYRLPNLQEPNG